jgi:hypothetical protein
MLRIVVTQTFNLTLLDVAVSAKYGKIVAHQSSDVQPVRLKSIQCVKISNSLYIIK